MTSSIEVLFDPVDRQWRQGSHENENENEIEVQRHRRWERAINYHIPIAGSFDELLVEHDWTQDKYPRANFRRLVRRERTTGEIRWQVTPDSFPAPGLRDGNVLLSIPWCRESSPLDWCVLVENTVQKQMMMLLPVAWKLDLADGQVSALGIPLESTPNQVKISSDGQTIVFFDDGYVHHKTALGGSSRRVTNADELVAWHPERGLTTLFKYPVGGYDSKFYHVLPDRRVLLVDHGSEFIVRIIPLDGTAARQVFP